MKLTLYTRGGRGHFQTVSADLAPPMNLRADRQVDPEGLPGKGSVGVFVVFLIGEAHSKALLIRM